MNFDEAAYISNAEKLPLNIVYVVSNSKEKVHIFNKLFSHILNIHLLNASKSPVHQLHGLKH